MSASCASLRTGHNQSSDTQGLAWFVVRSITAETMTCQFLLHPRPFVGASRPMSAGPLCHLHPYLHLLSTLISSARSISTAFSMLSYRSASLARATAKALRPTVSARCAVRKRALTS